jgi:hypothetical protein
MLDFTIKSHHPKYSFYRIQLQKKQFHLLQSIMMRIMFQVSNNRLQTNMNKLSSLYSIENRTTSDVYRPSFFLKKAEYDETMVFFIVSSVKSEFLRKADIREGLRDSLRNRH